MTNEEKVQMLESMTGETDQGILLTYLSIAQDKVLKRLYPFDDTVMEMPSRYDLNQVQIACYLLNKRGAEGETSHSENGVSRTYESGDVPDSLYRGIIPYAGVVTRK